MITVFSISFSSIYLKEKSVPFTLCLEQLVEGLKTYGLLSIIRKEKELFQSISCKNDLFEWNFDEFDDLFEIGYSNDGSSKKRLKTDTVKTFTDAMKAIFYEGMFHNSLLYFLVSFTVYWKIIKLQNKKNSFKLSLQRSALLNFFSSRKTFKRKKHCGKIHFKYTSIFFLNIHYGKSSVCPFFFSWKEIMFSHLNCIWKNPL